MAIGKMSLLSLPRALENAQDWESTGEWAAAESIYREILGSFPNHPRTLGLLGTLLLRNKCFEEALALFDKALAADRSCHWIHNGRGCALEGLGQKAASVSSYRKAAELQPEDEVAANNLKRMLGQLGRFSMGSKKPSSGRIRALAITVAPDWWTIARLPSQLVAAGFDVAAFCPEHSFLALTDFVNERYFLQGDEIADELADAVAAWKPDLIVPGDEFAVHLLHHVDRLDVPAHLRQLIRRSCGDSRFYDVVSDKSRTLEEAASLGIRHPAQALAAELDAFSAVHGYPLLIKMSIGMAGKTVRACSDSTTAAAAITELQHLLLPPYAPPSSLSVQKHIDGYPASVSFVALDGCLLDSFTYRTEESATVCGPSCVIKRIDYPEIEQIARQLIAHFGFTGFGGFDFMIESGSGAVHLLEMNPRVTISSHLGTAFGHDLSHALHAAMTGAAIPPSTNGNEVVAIFPQEWWRDAASPYLKRYFSDVPWDDPKLLSHVISMKKVSAL
ncbi:conserved hypothetical protein [Candidatus Terasakiella magnetica]|nr:conserved hypothetical protein [Candidatus Terasakiella magnetica]